MEVSPIVMPSGPTGVPETAHRRATAALRRIRPRLHARYRQRIAERPRRTNTEPYDLWSDFDARLSAHFPVLYGHLLSLYADRDDLFFHVERLMVIALDAWLARPVDLRYLDAQREGEADWLLNERMIGAVCYVDRFARTLNGLSERLPYLRELGVTMLHLMPLFKTPTGENDGGYAVSSYREVAPRLGTVGDLARLAAELRQADISLALDFIFNHTANDHDWVQTLQESDDPNDEDVNAYLTFPDRSLPDAYQQTLREIFPEARPGSFTYDEDLQRWVWTTFHSYQWDLNYANPAVFVRMAGELLFLANVGAEILRLDAVAFTWKRLGTPSENLAEAHVLVRAYNALARIACPSTLFLSEAIVHPDEVVTYIDPQECQLSYNPLQMALGWEALATRDVRLLRQSLSHRFALPANCAWVNYVRSHDDIGWTFDDGDAAAIGIHGFDHRQFLNAFYTGRFPGSFARGLPFQENPRTGDARISGTTASLAGLEKATAEEGPDEVNLAIGRLLLLYGVAISLEGIPLIYLGDEIATRNDLSYRDDLTKVDDSRWVHRPEMDWDRAAGRTDLDCTEGRVFTGLQTLIGTRRRHSVFGAGQTAFPALDNDQVLGIVRENSHGRLVILANFSEQPQTISGDVLGRNLRSASARDLLNEHQSPLNEQGQAHLAPYQLRWLIATDRESD